MNGRPTGRTTNWVFFELALIGWMTLSPLTPLAAPDEQSRLWTFDTDSLGTLPQNFVVGTLFDRTTRW